MERIEVDKDEILNPGDIVELHFSSIGLTWIKAAQLAAIEWWINRNHKDFTIRSWEIPENNKIIFTVRVNKTNPVAVTALLIAGAISMVGVVAWLSLDKVYKILESPAGAVAVGGLGSLALAAGITALLAVLGKSK